MADDYRQVLQRSYRESNTTTVTTSAIEARATIVAQYNKQQLTKAHYRKFEKSEMIMTIKRET